MYCLAHLPLFPGSIESGGQYIGSQRNADKQIDEHIDQCRGGTYSRQRLTSGEPSHHNDIHCIEQQLQNAGHHQGQCKGDQLVHNRAVAHIYFIFVFLLCCFHNFISCNSLPNPVIFPHRSSASAEEPL